MTAPRLKPDSLPSWPRLLTRDLAAAYVGMSEEKFSELVAAGIVAPPFSSREGDRWDLWGLQDIEIPEPEASPLPRRWSEYEGISGVYFIGFRDYVKIGISASIGYRLRNIEQNSPEQITVFATWAGATRSDERDLHHRFRHLRTRGEWFRKADDLMKFINGLKTGGDK